ncbi:methionine aminopeptidase 1-like [Artemia franciscana]|uniref:methionine aminopeptidase 1-like n=1 Tax=Artemia franciscana TaxID=6661 RepID=UPI0032DBA5E7
MNVCTTVGCSGESKLQCPTCVKKGIVGSYFCSQECFKSSWSVHKVLHQTKGSSVSTSGNGYNPWPSYTFSGSLRPYPQTPRRSVPTSIERPDYANHKEGISLSEQSFRGTAVIKQLDDDEIDAMRVACKLAREVLEEGAKAVEGGVTTEEIDRIIHEATLERDCYPSPLNYYEFPKSCCTSVNEVICHGIPDLRPLQNGDICNLDVTVYHHGYHGDLNETLFVGEVSEKAKKLVQTTYECLQKAQSLIKPGTRYRDVGDVIQKHAQKNGFSVVRSYCGHGIHKLFHTAPNVPHYARNKAIGVMKPGHVFTIEPMINEGTWRDTLWPDDWTAVTVDGKLSAQFEQTFLVTDTGCDVLTERLTNNGQPHFMDKL